MLIFMYEKNTGGRGDCWPNKTQKTPPMVETGSNNHSIFYQYQLDIYRYPDLLCQESNNISNSSQEAATFSHSGQEAATFSHSSQEAATFSHSGQVIFLEEGSQQVDIPGNGFN